LALQLFGGVPALVFGSPKIQEPEGTKFNLIWHRPGSGMGDLKSPWKPDYEFVHVIGDGFSYSERVSSVLSFPWDTFRGDALHPHRKPVDLLINLIEKCPAGIVVDLFHGSGSTMVACENLGRRCRAIEISPAYVAVALERMSTAFPALDIRRVE
jgi:DNA modification methylase